MTEHEMALADLAPSDDQADRVKGGAPLVLDLSPLARISISIPGLGL
jgi:hypothetical protein